MHRQILLCVETNKKAQTDYQYIVETIKHFYVEDKKVRFRPIYLESKTKYNAKDKVKEIEENRKKFQGETTVIFFIDADDYDVSHETKKLYDDIENYCKINGYEFVFFYRDVEDVYLGNTVHDKEKVGCVATFKRKRLIENVNEEYLRTNTHKRHCSNILNVLDKYWKRK